MTLLTSWILNNHPIRLKEVIDLGRCRGSKRMEQWSSKDFEVGGWLKSDQKLEKWFNAKNKADWWITFLISSLSLMFFGFIFIVYRLCVLKSCLNLSFLGYYQRSIGCYCIETFHWVHFDNCILMLFMFNACNQLAIDYLFVPSCPTEWVLFFIMRTAMGKY